jgi:hypothetical protein
MKEDAGQKQYILTAGALCLLRVFKISEKSLRKSFGDATPLIGAIALIGDVKKRSLSMICPKDKLNHLFASAITRGSQDICP